MISRRASTFLCVLIIGFCFVGIARGANWQDARLDAISSSLAQHTSPVYCENDQAEWDSWDALFSQRSGGFTWSPSTSTRRPAQFQQFHPYTVYIGPFACAGLHAILDAPDSLPVFEVAYAIGVLVHEDMHQRLDSGDEGRVECAAYGLFKDTALTVFHVAPTITITEDYEARVARWKYSYKRVHGKRVRVRKRVFAYVTRQRPLTIDNPFLLQLVSNAEYVHSQLPPAYRTVC